MSTEERTTSALIINSNFVVPPDGVIVTNFVFDNEPQFKSRVRTKPLQHFVLHETAGRTAVGCKTSLLRKGYGVHLILARDGGVSCHGDLANDVMVHANQLNDTSVGIEVVNPYAPKIAGKMNVQTLPAQWWTWCPDREDRRYVLPSQAQLKTLSILVPWLCDKLGIPYEFPTGHFSKKLRKIKGWRKAPLGWRAKPAPGVVVHQDFASHADGRFLLGYLMQNTAN